MFTMPVFFSYLPFIAELEGSKHGLDFFEWSHPSC
jgi:hypothetical protein